MIEACGGLRFAAEARECFTGIRVITQHAFAATIRREWRWRARGRSHPFRPRPVPHRGSRASRDASCLKFDFGQERVETLAPRVFIFGQPGLEQTPEAKSAYTQRGVTVRALVRLERNRRKRISEAVEIHLGEVKFVGARGGHIIISSTSTEPGGRSSQKPSSGAFRSAVARPPDQRNGFCVDTG